MCSSRWLGRPLNVWLTGKSFMDTCRSLICASKVLAAWTAVSRFVIPAG